MNLPELGAAIEARGIFVAGDEAKLFASCPVPSCYGTLTARQNGNGLEASCTDGHDLREILEEFDDRQRYTPTGVEPPASWLEGAAVDPFAEPTEPLPTVAGIPFVYQPASVLITGPTGSGRSSLLEAVLYDAVRTSPYTLRAAYLSGEVTDGECNARAADLADRRGDEITDDLRGQLANLRWLDLGGVIERAWNEPEAWADDMQRLYNIVAIDPVSTVASALGLDFDKSNSDYVEYHDRLIKPLIDRGMIVLAADNIGHSLEAKSRAKGASAKQDKADVVLACSLRAGPALAIKAMKVRSVRAPFRRGDSWLFDRDTQRITRATDETHDGEATFRPTALMEKVSRALEAEPGLTRNGVRAAVKGKGTYVDLALELLVAEGYVDVKRDGRANCHRSLKPYRVPVSQPFPDRVPETAGGTVSPSPTLQDSGNGTRSQDPADRVPDVDRAERLLTDHADLNGESI